MLVETKLLTEEQLKQALAEQTEGRPEAGAVHHPTGCAQRKPDRRHAEPAAQDRKISSRPVSHRHQPGPSDPHRDGPETSGGTAPEKGAAPDRRHDGSPGHQCPGYHRDHDQFRGGAGRLHRAGNQPVDQRPVRDAVGHGRRPGKHGDRSPGRNGSDNGVRRPKRSRWHPCRTWPARRR